MKKICNYIIIALFLLMVMNCQSPENKFSLPEPNPVSAEITLNSTGSATQTIGPEGGMIEISGTDSWDYRFTIPEGFLISKTEITMTPIASLTSPMLKGFTAGVHFEPNGLVLPGIAWLEISGDDVRNDLVGITYEGDGDEVALGWAEVEGSTIRVPITHFSGGGAGSPAPGSADRSPSNTMRAMGQAIVAAYLANDTSCIGQEHPLGEIVVTWYEAVFESTIEPKLEAAKKNDLLLSEAITAVMEWKAWRQLFDGLLCPDIIEALEECQSDDRADILMAKGLVNAIDIAADYCATAHDLGEIKHMFAWEAVSQLLPDDVEIDLRDQVFERAKGCLTFELQFESLVEVYEYTNSMTFSAQMKSTIGPLYPNAQGQIMGLIGKNDSPTAFGPLIYTPKLNYPSKPGCDVVISRIETKPASAQLPEVKILDPIRYVPINPNKPRQPETKEQETSDTDEGETSDTDGGETSDTDGGETKDKNKMMLIFYPLEGSEFIELTCSDLWGSNNPDGAWGPYTFNGLHEEDMNYVYEGFEFELEWGYGELFGWATSEKNALDIAKEKTTFELIHKAPRVQKGKE